MTFEKFGHGHLRTHTSGNVKVVKVLVDACCDPDLRDQHGKTPLHVVAQNLDIHGCPDNIAIVNHLLYGQ